MRKEIISIINNIKEKANQSPDYYSRLLTNLSECKENKCVDESLNLTESEMDILRDVYKNK